MTLNEFKAWLDGFGAAINGAPDKYQWDAIKKKLATVNSGLAIAPAPSADKYVPPYTTAVPLPHITTVVS